MWSTELNTLTGSNKALSQEIRGEETTQGSPWKDGCQSKAKSLKEETCLSSGRIWAKGRNWRIQITLLHYQKTSSPQQAGLFSLVKFLDQVEVGQFLALPLETPVRELRQPPPHLCGHGSLFSLGGSLWPGSEH